MNPKLAIVFVLATIAISLTGYAYGDSHEPKIIFSEFQFAVIGIGVIAGFVTAYNGYARNKRQAGDTFKFDRSKFLDRVFMAILGSIPLAVAESANIVVLDIFGAWIIFAASLGTAELIMEVRGRNKTK